ncbi:MAG TPA: hypothetical protein VK756_07925 [Solirubrobacteraceae bacterium]|nr:hypothetical protein [Solirubrobacteraceae bacterium]
MADQAASAAAERSSIDSAPETPTAIGAPAAGVSTEVASPAEPAASPGFGARGRMRRRLRFLRKARELAYRDLGGLVFEMHRLGERRDELAAAKLATLAAIDSELRALEDALDARRPLTILRESGIAACPRCAAIHGSEDHFCPSCGLAMERRADRPIAVAAPAGSPLGAAAPTTTAPPASAAAPTTAAPLLPTPPAAPPAPPAPPPAVTHPPVAAQAPPAPTTQPTSQPNAPAATPQPPRAPVPPQTQPHPRTPTQATPAPAADDRPTEIIRAPDANPREGK